MCGHCLMSICADRGMQWDSHFCVSIPYRAAFPQGWVSFRIFDKKLGHFTRKTLRSWFLVALKDMYPHQCRCLNTQSDMIMWVTTACQSVVRTQRLLKCSKSGLTPCLAWSSHTLLTFFIRPLVPSWASRRERAFCLQQVWRPGWLGCCESSVFLHTLDPGLPWSSPYLVPWHLCVVSQVIPVTENSLL